MRKPDAKTLRREWLAERSAILKCTYQPKDEARPKLNLDNQSNVKHEKEIRECTKQYEEKNPR